MGKLGFHIPFITTGKLKFKSKRVQNLTAGEHSSRFRKKHASKTKVLASHTPEIT